jgi:hypothetical protein
MQLCDHMFKRSRPSKDVRLPISRDLLENNIKVPPAVCMSAYESKLFSAAFSITFRDLLG